MHIVGMAINEFDLLIPQRRCHGNPATWEGGVSIERSTGFFFFFTGIAGQQRGDIFRAADAFEHLVDTRAIRTVETSACLGHQAQVRCTQRSVRREMIGWRGRAIFVCDWVIDREVVRSIGTNLIFWQAGAAIVRQGTDRHLFQTVAGRTDLSKDLKTALQLVLVIRAKGTFEREGEILDVLLATTCRKRCGRDQRQSKGSTGCKFLEHV